MSTYHKNDVPHITELSLNVSNLSDSTNFYQDVIGLRVLYKDEEKAFLGEEEVILRLYQTTYKKMNSIGLYHVAFLHPSMTDLANWYHLFRQKEIRHGAGDHHVSVAIYFEDPDGNGIEVYADRDDAIWENDGSIQMGTSAVDFQHLLKQRNDNKSIKAPVIGHLHFQTSNVSQATNFFVDLGMDQTFSLGSASFLSYQRYHHHLAFNTWNTRGLQNYIEESIGIKNYVLYMPEEIMQKIVKEKHWEKYVHEDQLIVKDPNGIPLYIEHKKRRV